MACWGMASPRTVVMVRFEEPPTTGSTAFTLPPTDEAGGLGQMTHRDPLNMGSAVDAPCGQGHYQEGAAGWIASDDADGEGTLLTRDLTIQAILSMDASSPDTSTLISRGDGSGPTEHVAYRLNVWMVDVANGVAAVMLTWDDSAGVPCTQLPMFFTLSAEVTDFFMLTCTRRWVNTAEVELAFYVNDRFIGEALSADGDIGGSTTGTTFIGWDGTGDGHHGTIDELRVTNYTMSAEEIQATWNRIAIYQEDGVAIVQGLLPPGLPVSNDPESRVQGDFRLIGQGIGQALAQAHNARDNLMPDRAYGEALARWERITGQAPGALDSIEVRRRRVVSHLKQRQGVSIPGVTTSLHDLLQLTPDQIQILAFANILTEDFATLRDERWWYNPAAKWSISGGALRGQAAGGEDIRDGIIAGATYLNGYYCRMPVDSPRFLKVQVKITGTTMTAGASYGVRLFDWVTGDFFFFGVSWDGANYSLVSERQTSGVSAGITVHATAAGAPPVFWLIIKQTTDPGADALTATWDLSWSTTSGIAGFTSAGGLTASSRLNWVDMFLRSNVAALPGALDAQFDDLRVTVPFGIRPFFAYAYRDPSLPGAPDVLGGHSLLQRMKHAHTESTVITSLSLLCDSDASVCDRGPMGAI